MLMKIYIYCKENIVGFFMTEKQTANFRLIIEIGEYIHFGVWLTLNLHCFICKSYPIITHFIKFMLT